MNPWVVPDFSEPAQPPGPRLRAYHWPALLLFAAIVPLVSWSVTAQGPAFLWLNMDPQYPYLMNSLALAEGHVPHHTDHPGTPVQLLGAAVLKATHAAAGRGTLRDDVLLHPEQSLGSLRVAMTLLVALLSLAGGAMAVRATGSLAHALAVQSSPLFVRTSMLMLDHFVPEPLLLGMGMALGGAVLLAVHRPAGFRPRRAAIAMGVITGVGIAVKVLFAPLALVPLAALGMRRLRLVYLASTTGALALSLVPIFPRLPATGRWLLSIATHTGRYGTGDTGIVDAHAWAEQLRVLAHLEPLYVTVTAAGLLGGVVAFAITRWVPDGPPRRAASCLLAVSLAQAVLLVLVAKHSALHYLAAGGSMAGLSMALTVSLGASLGRPWRAGAAVLLMAAALTLVGTRASYIKQWRRNIATVTERELTVSRFMRSAEGAGVIHGAQISTPEAALHYGNRWVHGRYSLDLARLYPGVLLWDQAGLTAFGRAATPAEQAGAWSSGRLRAMVPPWFDAHQFRPVDLSIITLRTFGPERLVLAGERPKVPEGTPAFCGFKAQSGLCAPERMRIPAGLMVRWGVAPETVLGFQTAGGSTLIVLDCRPHLLSGQSMTLSLDGAPVRVRPFETPQFDSLVVRLDLPPGEHELRLSYANAQNLDGRELAVLFRKIQIVPATP